MAGKAILYSYWRSSCSYRVRIALNLKGILYEIKPVDIVKGGEQHSDAFKQLNPIAKVPVLHIDGHNLIESLNIMTYLEETRPQTPLMPREAIHRAKVREICEVIASGIQPLQNLDVLRKVGKDRSMEWAHFFIHKGFAAVEKLLASSSGKHCVGDEVTLADCCLVPQLYNARRYKMDLEAYPTIVRIERELANHPAFRTAHPSHQPDCPPEQAK